MKGQYVISIENRKVKYELVIDRSVTVIKGNSGTGKTTLIRMIQGYEAQGNKSGIRYRCAPTVRLHVLMAGMNWDRELIEHKGEILFIDESVDYLYSEAFQIAFASADSYLVVISRSGKFSQLPFSVDSIYELKTESKQDVNLTRMCKFYSFKKDTAKPNLIITEDSNSGMDMMNTIFPELVTSAKGNSSVPITLNNHYNDDGMIFVLVDGAAFGGYIARTMNIANLRGDTIIFAPESFEYMLLKSDSYYKHLTEELTSTYDFCDSKDFMTWERYYTALLDTICFDYYGFHYSKKRLEKCFLSENVVNQVEECMYQNAIEIAD